MKRLTVLLLTVSISFESLAVLTQLFLMKASHDHCPIILVSNDDTIENTGDAIQQKRMRNTKLQQIQKLEQIWSLELASTTETTHLITDDVRPMLLLYRSPP